MDRQTDRQWRFIPHKLAVYYVNVDSKMSIFIWSYTSSHVKNGVEDLGAEAGELRVILLIEVIQRSHVLAVTDQPVHRWKVFALSQLLVQTPEHLNYAKSCRRHRVREVTTRRRHATQHLIENCINQNARQWTEQCLHIQWIKTVVLFIAVCVAKFTTLSASVH